MTQPLRVLILCTGNSARSQMAEGLLRQFGGRAVEVHSAGTRPQPAVHPLAVATMRDRFGIDISAQVPKTVDRFLDRPLDYVITVCDSAAEDCPVFPAGPQRLHWSFPDPAAVRGTPDEQRRAFEQVATDIAARLKDWLATRASREKD
jgi:arsenate reductase